MQNLIEMIPSKAEYSSMGEEQRENLSFSLNTALQRHDLRVDDPKYHSAEIMAIMLSKYGYIMDLIEEFDLAIDHNS
jgi:hypothetical protein